MKIKGHDYWNDFIMENEKELSKYIYSIKLSFVIRIDFDLLIGTSFKSFLKVQKFSFSNK